MMNRVASEHFLCRAEDVSRFSWRIAPGMMLALLLLIGTVLSASAAAPSAKKIAIERIEPPNWWVDMQDTRVQLMVYGQGIGLTKPAMDYPGVQLVSAARGDSENYLFIDLNIAPSAEAGIIKMRFLEDGKKRGNLEYELRERAPGARMTAGFDASDAIVLITPDRFANGNPGNDVVEGLREQMVDRNEPFARHGGDIQGITQQLDYLQKMGFTAVWPSPLLTNDMNPYSYHGYAITDFYGVDPRFGSLAEYMALADALRQRGMKLIQDQVVNHCGDGHWWMLDPPFQNWINHQGNWQRTNHKHSTLIDPYAAEVDKRDFTNGWFVETMPDLNQRQPMMARYLIQNSIWWIETLGLGGIRQDTYPYADEDFLDAWSCAIMNEYPDFAIVGEEWVTNPLQVAHWQKGSPTTDGCLGSVMDFPMQAHLVSALKAKEQWNSGWINVYEGMSYDVLYADPLKLLVFADNHDMDRIMTQLDDDPALVKMALTWVATVRGIPQFYYGTEIGLSNTGNPGDHGVIRADFPGGWEGDLVNGFTGSGLSAEQADLQTFMRRLLTWRKGQSVLHNGKTMHWAPQKGQYAMARYDASNLVLILYNKSEEEQAVDWSHFDQALKGKRKASSVMDSKPVSLDGSLKVPARSVLILEF